ncbi:lysophospholipid acyltransferase family protein [Aliikangiella sp. G2MR2-5]|uniref:lysophospholipid acyltransferase family protein n=1 Tax=Aliikangiella sp. G2MR2-5 TaxID=2788943 RepID=UPI0018A89FB4|nr:lysophospholipid acyltransferase family protein [Aliikangiella sp. G2MR2-5]
MTENIKKSSSKGRLAVGLIYVLHWLPGFLVNSISRFLAIQGLRKSRRNARVVQRNLELCFPELADEQVASLAERSLEENSLLVKEFAHAWLGNRASIEKKIIGVNGRNILEQPATNKKPVIIAVPHLGNWEYFWQWLQFNYSAVGMYSPAEYPELDNLILNARERFGGQVFATDSKGLMGLMKALKRGGVMMILPDQVPKAGAGNYAPFFGQSAFTMTLLHKFLNKTGAQLLFGAAIREQVSGRFFIDLKEARFDYQGLDANEFNQQMNMQLEDMIRQYPQQYQWDYKRFKSQADGTNFYQ